MQYQIWEVTWQDKERFSFRVFARDKSLETFMGICKSYVGAALNKELWLIEEDKDGIYNCKYKFKWERH